MASTFLSSPSSKASVELLQHLPHAGEFFKMERNELFSNHIDLLQEVIKSKLTFEHSTGLFPHLPYRRLARSPASSRRHRQNPKFGQPVLRVELFSCPVLAHAQELDGRASDFFDGQCRTTSASPSNLVRTNPLNSSRRRIRCGSHRVLTDHRVTNEQNIVGLRA